MTPPHRPVHIHLDLVGGLSGDMFIGAMLDCFPHYREALPGLIDTAGFRDLVTLTVLPANDGILTGTRFLVVGATDAAGHAHRHYRDIIRLLNESALPEETRTRALDIFRLLAEAEADIHGKEIERVTFHEVGAWDAIADVVCTAHLLSLIEAGSWSVSRLPLGRGQVRTAHGMLPIPAPATARLLHGFEFIDDGIEGERITPTGAAILKHLAPSQGARPGAMTLTGTGYGFGTRTFPGISNVVRALVFEATPSPVGDRDQVLRLAFEIDDQTPEAVATALDRLRAQPGVLDVAQFSGYGKKGRQLIAIRVLAMPDQEESITAACFDETTTLGVRRQLVDRRILRRHPAIVHQDGIAYRVKVVDRPSGTTAKLEEDEVPRIPGNPARRRDVRHQLESEALRRRGRDDTTD